MVGVPYGELGWVDVTSGGGGGGGHLFRASDKDPL